MKIDYVCTHCGSNDVLVDAYAEWNVEAQRWEISNVFDKGHHCNNCNGECKIEEVGIK
jgi:hypothetical protein